ncbi:MAG: carbohydrate kinase [Deltaproteobacteria bacterium CG11_big_fil_rev_8_21_14_0_20_47_16]|nr:MAG: carbohydrate kinase [Deltaproteobacteria bacterium CG11_big_fil_rev_8_21_14_0_20_47_16]
MPHTIVGIGEFIWDIFPTAIEPGGAVANVLQHAHHMGEDAILVSRVGDDEFGKRFFNMWHEHGLTTDYVTIDPTLPTGSVVINHHPNGDATYSRIPPIASDFIPYTDELKRLAQTADAICFGCFGQWGNVSRETIQAMLTQTNPSCLRVVDINLRPGRYTEHLVLSSLEEASVLKLNDDELKIVAGYLNLHGDLETQIKTIIRQFDLKLVALTRAAEGALLITHDNKTDSHPGIPVKIVDTVGAGDAFTAALVAGLLKGLPLSKLNDFANRVGSYVCTQLGAAPKLPSSLLEF